MDQTTRGERIAQLAMVVAGALVVVLAVGFVLRGGVGDVPGVAEPTATPSPSSSAAPPRVTFAHDTCCDQTARFLRAQWTSTEAIRSASVALVPAPPFDCAATVDATGRAGTIGCVGLLAGATSFVATLKVGTTAGEFTFSHPFRTMANSLTNVKWFTEFEDVRGDPLACAAASCRIVQVYATGQDPLTAQQILDTGKALNRSRDPGLDPAGIAGVITRMDPRDRYHYYVLPNREEATKSAAYWLVRSGKPVIVISLAGQHAPVLTGFRGSFGTFYGDPSNSVTGVVIEDPQRGDMRPETANHRPDKYRTPGFQTGQLLELSEWYTDEWWLGFSYAGSIKMPDGTFLNIERSDGAYPLPHWAGKYVILADDGDAENPPDREGRVVFR